MSSVSGNQKGVSLTDLQSEKQGATLALLTIIGIGLYVALDVIAQVLPPHYSPIRQPESDLAVGPYGWVMTINFVLRGLLSFAFIAALIKGTTAAGRSRAGLILLGIWAVGALLLAAFPTDVGTPITRHGAIHLLVALVAFICVAVGEILLSRRFATEARWQSLRRPALTIAIITLIACVLTFVALRTPGLDRLGGLIERLFLGLALLWMLVVALRVRALPASA